MELVSSAEKLLATLRPPPETVVGWMQTGAVVSVSNLWHPPQVRNTHGDSA